MNIRTHIKRFEKIKRFEIFIADTNYVFRIFDIQKYKNKFVLLKDAEISSISLQDLLTKAVDFVNFRSKTILNLMTILCKVWAQKSFISQDACITKIGQNNRIKEEQD